MTGASTTHVVVPASSLLGGGKLAVGIVATGNCSRRRLGAGRSGRVVDVPGGDPGYSRRKVIDPRPAVGELRL